MGGITRILVVDDDESIRKGLKTVLEEEGYIVDTAETGNEAIEKAKVNFYNLALIDIRLPDIEGTKLLTALKETTPKMVKIIVTGYPTLQNAIEAVNKDADSYLLKPLDIGNLLNTIKIHLGKQEEEKTVNEKKFAKFVETRAKEWEEEKIVTRKKTNQNFS